MTVAFLFIPLLLVVGGGLVVWMQGRRTDGFDADLQAFQQQIGAVAPSATLGATSGTTAGTTVGTTSSGPTDGDRSVVDYPSRFTATDQRS